MYRNFCRYTSGIMGFVSRMIQKYMYQNHVSDEAVGTEAEFEEDVGG